MMAEIGSEQYYICSMYIMKKVKLFFIIIFVFVLLNANAQSTDSTLDIVNWNLEWFGSTEFAPNDDSLQQQNVIAVLKYLDADIYALCEVVDSTRLRHVVTALGSDFDFTISDFTSFASNMQDPDWATGQKLAFVYNKKIVSNVKVRGLLRNSSDAYYNFASGRLPYMLNANVDIQGRKRNITLISIHAKSGSSADDYYRKLGGTNELKDTMDAAFINKPMIFLGDYNDDLDFTICTGISTTESSYHSVAEDSIDDTKYISITLPLSKEGQNSTIDFPDVIDHQIISASMDSMYVQGSASIRKDIEDIVKGYKTNNTSDHYPVFSQYKIIDGDTSEAVAEPPPVAASGDGFTIFPNPFNTQFSFANNTELTNIQVYVYTNTGAKIYYNSIRSLYADIPFTVQLPNVAAGIYHLVINSDQLKIKFTLFKNN